MNVIVIKTDQQRFDTLSCMGHSVIETPNIDRIAERGCVFENAFCTTTLCVPSRVGFFTGKYVHRTGATGNANEHHIQKEDWSFINELKEKGYRIGIAGKNHAFTNEHLEEYFDYAEVYGHWGKQMGTITPEDEKVNAWLRDANGPGKRTPNGNLMEGLIDTPMPFEEQELPTWRIAEDAIQFLDQYGEDPFFLHYSFPDPHFPNTICEPYYSMYTEEMLELEGQDIDWSEHPFAHFVQSQSSGFDEYTEEERKKILGIYLAQIHFIDKAIGLVLDKLEDKGLMEKTVLVFTSDHGDFGGQFGLVGKTKAFYEPIIRIPLVMSVPRGEAGKRISANISNIDVMPTIAELLDLHIPENVQGRSFLQVMEGNALTHRNEIFAEVGNLQSPPAPIAVEEYQAYNKKREKEDGVFWFIEYTTRGKAAMIRRDNWKYCYYTGDKEELYDFEKDPLEKENLANKAGYTVKKTELKNALLEWIMTEPLR